jgi:ABC-2 type transport system ATP-binding protein
VTSYSVQGSDAAIAATGLVKRFGRTIALDGFDLEVAAGTVCGLLGPNGAGKTTAVRILTTLLRADAGTASVAGFDVATQAHLARRALGLSGQTPAVDEILSGRQNLVLFGRLNGFTKSVAQRRADELLAQFELTEAADRPVKKYSGGMRRRIDLAVTLILAPAVLFLDEPTTGLDPRNRIEVWESIRRLVAQGTTVLLTTQYLDEADQLADRVAVMDRGKVIATGSPNELKARVGGDRVELVLADDVDLTQAMAVIEQATGARPEPYGGDELRISVAVSDRVQGLTAVLTELVARDVAVTDIGLRRPTLDDVFLTITGHRTEPAEGQATTDEREEIMA